MTIVFDLDDTLYDEIDFVKSGLKAVSGYINRIDSFEFMWEYFCLHGSGKIFDVLIETYQLSLPLAKLVEIYRFHQPTIVLDKSSKELLTFSTQYHNALITDGHIITQKNKYHALGLERYLGFVVFSDAWHTAKPNEILFKKVMHEYPHDHYVYIADNPKKDFISPRNLGWTSIRYKNPVGIYRNLENNATFEVESKEQILELLKTVV